MSIFSRLSLAFAVLTGSDPSQELQMQLTKVQAQVDELTAALNKAASAKAADQSQIHSLQASLDAANATVTDLQTQLADAETQITTLLQPVVDQANALAA
jgi:chromosome segregation ATPase